MKTWGMSSAILLHLRTHLSYHFLGKCTMMNRAALAWKRLLFLWLLQTCQATCPQEIGCGSLKHKVWRWGSNRDYNNQKDLYFCLETWLGLANFFGPVPRKMWHTTVSELSLHTFHVLFVHEEETLTTDAAEKGISEYLFRFCTAAHLHSSPAVFCFLFMRMGLSGVLSDTYVCDTAVAGGFLH